MEFNIDINKEFEELIKLAKEGKAEIEYISFEPHLQPRYLTDDLKETARKSKLEYYEYTITIRKYN